MPRIEVWHLTDKHSYAWGVYYSWRAVINDLPLVDELRWRIVRVSKPRAIQLLLMSR